jgi:glycerol-3-phosphate O-acyltransferase
MGKLLKNIVLSLAIFILLNQAAMSAEAAKNKMTKADPLIIQSQVKGSQEQPNVIYIMPWQGVGQVIEVKEKKRTIKLPHFKPINPSVFKKQVRLFANKP